VAVEGSSRSDSVIYLTLVDFLLQLIFFGIFLFVAYYPSKPQDLPSLTKEFQKYGVPILEGFGELITAENVQWFQRLAKFIHNQAELISLVQALEKAGSVDDLVQMIDLVQSSGGLNKVKSKLLGQPACLPDRSSLMTVEAADTYLFIANVTEPGAKVLAELHVGAKVGDRLTFAEFTNRFRPLLDQKVDGVRCVHFAKYDRTQTALEAPRMAFEKIFLMQVR